MKKFSLNNIVFGLAIGNTFGCPLALMLMSVCVPHPISIANVYLMGTFVVSTWIGVLILLEIIKGNINFQLK